MKNKDQVSSNTHFIRLAGALAGLGLALAARAADPRTNGWFTADAGRYARISTNDAMLASGTVLTTWSNGSQTQSAPAYCGVQEVYSSSHSVYVRSSGLASYNMGPWQHGAFPNLPVNQKLLYRLPRTNNVPATKAATGAGQIGIFVDGVEMFNSWDAFYWNGSAEVGGGGGTGYWNRDAYVNEGATFDAGNAHQQNTGTYHYHANPPGLRYLLGDNVNYNPAAKTYAEATNPPVKHSPILGWVADGFPIYGPYGYSNATNAGSGLRRMISGYVIRNGSFGTSNLPAYGRTTIPQWAVRLYSVSSNQAGPNVSTSYPLGRYLEDNDYLGDRGFTQGVDFDLDEYNGRFCVTPEFPNGTYAYFVAIASNGAPVFPYNIGRGYYGSPAGGSVASIGEPVLTNFLGGPAAAPSLNAPTVKNGAVTLTWSATEGGSYMVQTTTNYSVWTTNATNISAVLVSSNGTNAPMASYTNTPPGNYQFYRVARTTLATYDSAGTGSTSGGGQTLTLSPTSGVLGATFTVSATINSGATPAPPPHTGAPVASFTIGANNVTGSSYTYNANGSGTVTGQVTNLAGTGSQAVTITFSPPPGQTQGPSYTQAAAFTISP